MEFTCTAAVLAAAVGDVARAVPSHPTQPMYSGVQIAANRGRLRLTAADETVTMIAGCSAKVATAGQVTVSAEPMTSWLRKLHGTDDVTVQVTATDMVIATTSGVAATFPVRTDQLPDIAWSGGKGKATGIGSLHTALQAAASVVGTGQVRLRTRNGRVCIDAPERNRVTSIAVPSTVEVDFDVVVPLPALKLLGDRPLHKVEVAGKKVRIVADTAAVTLQTSEQSVPDLDPLLAARSPHHIDVDRSRLMAAVERLQLLGGHRNTTVELTIGRDRLDLTATSERVTRTGEQLPLAAPAPVESVVLIGGDYLMAAARSIPSPTVRLAYGSDTTPLHVTAASDLERPGDTGDVAWVIAPIKVRSG